MIRMRQDKSALESLDRPNETSCTVRLVCTLQCKIIQRTMPDKNLRMPFGVCLSECMTWTSAVRCGDSPGVLRPELLLKKPAGTQRLHPRHSHSLCHAGHTHQHPQFASYLLDSARSYCPGPAYRMHDTSHARSHARSHATSGACHITYCCNSASLSTL